MIGVDMNVLIRYIVQDDLSQCTLVNQYFKHIAETGEKVFVGTIVLCELCWVLESVYDYSSEAVARLIEKMIRSPSFVIENAENVWESLPHYSESRLDLADLLIGKINRRSGCEYTITFDKKASKLSDFRLLS